MKPILTKRWFGKTPVTLAAFQEDGGYRAFEKALAMKPEEIVAEVKGASLFGRGGAGFPAGMKWELCLQAAGRPKYLVVNADESEPGTFKDVQIIERDPHLFLEGMLIAMRAITATRGYIYIRGEFARGARTLSAAVEEIRAAGLIARLAPDAEIVVHRGAGAYICGEETALLESLEGKIGQPRLKPPFPVTHGAWQKPTVVNNVETLACVPGILSGGAEKFAKEQPKLYCLSGHIRRPGVYEAPYGIPLRELVYGEAYGGGPHPGHKIAGAFPGGSSAPPFREDEFDVPMTFKDIGAKGSMLGSAAVIVFDERACVVEIARNIMHFYADESCGKCTPCRDGNHYVERTLAAAVAGTGEERMLGYWDFSRRRIFDDCFCPLAKGAMWAFGSLLDRWRGDFEAHARGGSCGRNGVA